MFIDEAESNKRVSSLDNLINRLNGKGGKGKRSRDSDDPYMTIRKIHNGSRGKGRENDDNETRAEIALASKVFGPNVASEVFNTTPSRASLLSNGIITHSKGVDSALESKVKDKKDKVHEKALDIIMSSLENLEDRIDKVTKPVDLSTIASNMAKIAEKTGGRLKGEGDNSPKVQVVVYAPRVKDASEFEEIEI